MEQTENFGFQMKPTKAVVPETKAEADSRFDREEALLNDVLGVFGQLDRDRSQNHSQDAGPSPGNRPHELGNAELLHQASTASISKPSTT